MRDVLEIIGRLFTGLWEAEWYELGGLVFVGFLIVRAWRHSDDESES